MDFAEYRRWSDVPEDRKVVWSLIFYQMVSLKGKDNVALIKVDQMWLLKIITNK